MRTRVVWLVAAIAPACLVKEPVADNPGDTDGETEGDGTATATMGDATADESDDGATGDVPGPPPVDGVVDCSTLPAGGPTVAGGEVSALGFPQYRCNPRQDPQDPTNTEYTCCAVDPAAEAGGLPNYMNKGIDGSTPYFSGTNNDLGTWGMCVRTADIPFGSGLTEPQAASCPIPCNPTWDAADLETVCGSGRVCCQTHELQAADCVTDPASGQWRPVTGEDIGVSDDDGGPITTWAPGEHATHQDPSGLACLQFAGGDLASPAFEACIAELTVADQRGVCMALGPAQACPHQQPGYVDACQQL